MFCNFLLLFPALDGSLAVTYIPPPPPETEEEIFAQGIHEGINFEKYEHIPVELTGTNAPKPVSCFNDAEIHAVRLVNYKLNNLDFSSFDKQDF